MKRPPPHDAPAGYVVVPREADGRWRVRSGEGHCSATRGRLRTRCAQQAAAELNRQRYTRRGRVATWYLYCPEHLADYARWVEGGRVMEWVSLPVETVETP